MDRVSYYVTYNDMQLLFAALRILPQRRAAVSSLAFVRRIGMAAQPQKDRKYAKLPKVKYISCGLCCG